MKGKCSLFPLDGEEKQFMDCTTSRKFYYMCGEKGRYYESIDKNQPLEIPDDYDFEIYLQLL